MQRKIYFAASIRGGRDDMLLYEQLIAMLGKYGQVLTELIGDQTLSAMGEDGPSDEYIYHRDISWLQFADVVVAEVTIPSLGVGYEVAKAEEWGKSILYLHRSMNGRRLSAMIGGSPHLTNASYTDLASAEEVLAAFFAKLSQATIARL